MRYVSIIFALLFCVVSYSQTTQEIFESFKLQERTYPIDFGYKDIYNYSLKINLNEGLTVNEIPDAVNFVLPNNAGTLFFSTQLTEKDLILYFKVKFNLPIYAPEYYPYLKSFMDKVVELQNNTVIILEKQ